VLAYKRLNRGTFYWPQAGAGKIQVTQAEFGLIFVGIDWRRARSVAQGGQVMMLDEATSSVDSITENLIQKAIGRLFEQKTVIAITHRLNTIPHSVQILVLNQGKHQD
jgi:ABC-type transport system involved in Fe-S cluster assembly fused permease/ATPase subunit